MINMKILPDPKWKLEELIKDDLLTENTFFVGCVSFEDRCNAAITRMSPVINNRMPLYFVVIDDDECIDVTWRNGCVSQTENNWKGLNEILSRVGSGLNGQPVKYLMSNRREGILMLKEDLNRFIMKNIPPNNIRCILDLSCVPSYFALQLLKHLIENVLIDDLIVLYTKPGTYASKDELLKRSPFSKSHPEFLASFRSPNITKGPINWIVSVGFDYDSVRNAEKIKQTLNIKGVYVVVPFPSYRPEYMVRAMQENQSLLSEGEKFFYAPADNPFRTFQVIRLLVGQGKNFIISTFGSKPMALGCGLAAIKLDLPILHVQATDYNPRFSQGQEDTLAYWIKYKKKPWWDYLSK